MENMAVLISGEAAFGQVRDAAVAEDLLQETFLAALQARDRFAGKCSERTWLAGILRHKIYLRRIYRERSVCSEATTPRKDQQSWDECWGNHCPKRRFSIRFVVHRVVL